MPGEDVLGRDVASPVRYAPDVLVPLDRVAGRSALAWSGPLPFTGVDLWTAWELSWLEPGGKPVAATAELRVPADSPRTVESKSLKLYLGSLNAERYSSAAAVAELIAADLGRLTGASVDCRVSTQPAAVRGVLPGRCLDELAANCNAYLPDARLLALAPGADTAPEASETLHSHLFRSVCPVTGQADWASVLIRYHGGRLDDHALLRYLVSYRQHAAFHEQCVERIFLDVLQRCQPRRLTVYARYLRRGGIDINPFRSNFETAPPNLALWRQ